MNILLICAAGASSACLAQSMRKATVKMGRPDIRVEAHSEYEFDSYIEDADVCLIGPHLKNMETSLREAADEYHVPLRCVSNEAYGTLNGELAVKEALSLWEEKG